MEGVIDGISNYIQPKEAFPKYTYEELMSMPYDNLYNLHSKLTLRRLNSGVKQEAFGNLTVDATPNKLGEASLHFAPLPSGSQNEDMNYVASNTEVLKMSLIGLEDLIRLLKHYSSLGSGNKLNALNGATTMAMADIAVKMGFGYVRTKRQESGEGRVRFITASLEKLVSNISHYEEALKRLELFGKKKGITPASIRAEIIASYK